MKMRVTLVTTMSAKGYQVYGRRMIESVAQKWPEDTSFHVFYEGPEPYSKGGTEPRETVWTSLDRDQDRAKFMASDHEDNPLDYRFRPKKYSNKVWAMTAAPRNDPVIFLDADTETKNRITPEILEHLLPPAGKIASYLARPYYRYTETGFLGFVPEAGPFLDELRRIYTSGEIFNLPEWHDCAAFDYARVRFERQGKRFHNLCPDAMGLEVFEQSPLACVIAHNKGPERKQRAYGDANV